MERVCEKERLRKKLKKRGKNESSSPSSRQSRQERDNFGQESSLLGKPVVLRPNGGLRTIQGPRRTDAKRDIIRVQLQDRCEDHGDQHRTEERPRILLLEGHGRHRNPIPHLR